jgi:hypothetical protein
MRILLACVGGAVVLSVAGAVSASSFSQAAPITCNQKTPCEIIKNLGNGSALDVRAIAGAGITALSHQGDAVVATSFGAPNNQFYTTSAIFGIDKSTNGLPNSGILGVTDAIADSAIEGDFNAFSNDPPTLSGAGVLGLDQSGTQNSGVFGVVGSSRGTGILAYSLSNPVPPGQRQFPALNAACAGGGVAIIASNGFISPGGDVMSLDCSGNLILKGTVLANSTPLIRTHTSGGQDAAMYAPQQSEATVEDVGESQLVDGAAYVRLDRRFASTMDTTRPYMVFITPNGPSRGLYVSDKTPTGFAVRENPGGRSTLAFDYRIVGRPYGAHQPRLPSANDVEYGFYRESLSAPHSTEIGSRWIARMKPQNH